MHAYVMRGPGRGTVEELSPPSLGPYDARVKTRVCGLCNTTDRMVRFGEFPPDMTFPSILGHESVGEIVELGEAVRNLSVGQLVTRSSAFALGAGPIAQNWGGLSDEGVVRDERAMLEDGIRESLTWLAQQQSVITGVDAECAALAISVSEAVSVARSAQLTGASVVVVGTGIAGLSLVMHARRSGAETVVAVGRRTSRLEHAATCGAHVLVREDDASIDDMISSNTHGGADVVFEASGDPTMVLRAASWCRPGGTAIVYGLSGHSASVEWQAVQRDVALVFPSTRETLYYPKIVRDLEDGILNSELLLSHRFEFGQLDRAFAAIDAGEVIKAVVTFDA